MTYTVAVVGSRGWPFPERVTDVLDQLLRLHGVDLRIVSGGARGVDRMAQEWAFQKNVPCIVHRPDWDLWGRSAGFVRNQYIIDDADECYAFQLNKSRGTQDSINKARQKGIPCHVVEALSD